MIIYSSIVILNMNHVAAETRPKNGRRITPLDANYIG